MNIERLPWLEPVGKIASFVILNRLLVYTLRSKSSTKAPKESIKYSLSTETVASEANTTDATLQALINLTAPIPCNFKSLESCLIVLRTARVTFQSNPNINKLDKFYEELDQLEAIYYNNRTKLMHNNDKQIIVIEGLNGSGKSTLIENLLEYCDNITKVDLPKDFIATRSILLSIFPFQLAYLHELVSLYYLSLNALLSTKRGHIIVMEKFYHSALTQNVCLNVNSKEEIASLNKQIFQWPVELPVPNLCIYLTCASDIRQIRNKNSNGSSIAERSSERTKARDAKVLTTFQKIEGPLTIAIDSNISPNDVLSIAIKAMSDNNIAFSVRESYKENKRISMGIYGAYNDIIP
jgi:thymidylate kinase